MEPVVLFFLFGLGAGLLGCDLKLNRSISDFAMVVLLLAIGLKGGMELHGSNFFDLAPKLLTVASLGLIIPLVAFPFNEIRAYETC